MSSKQAKRTWTLTIDPDGGFICHGDITGDPASEPGWRAVEVVAVDALLSDEIVTAVAVAQYAAEREISIDPEMYANRLVEDEYRKFARIALEAAVNAASNREEN